jgi:hypothetical protein
MILLLQEDDEREGDLAAGPFWASSEWAATEAGALQILPYGLDGHQVKEVVGSMQLQRIVLLTDRLQVSLFVFCDVQNEDTPFSVLKACLLMLPGP